MMKFFLPILFLLVNCSITCAKKIPFGKCGTIITCDTILSSETEPILILVRWNTDSVLFVGADTMISVVVSNSVQTKRHANNKTIAAILAFPLPFGILGLHRIYLGTKPYMPFAYIGTLGGCFGILPFIDFIFILTADDDALKRFENNPKVFMWSH